MNRIITTYETASSWSPYKAETKKFLQDANIEALSNLTKALITNYSSTTLYVLWGCVNSGVYPNYAITAGAVFFNGEIYTVPAATFTSSGTDVAIATITDVPDAVADPTTFSDNTQQYIHRVRTILISSGASGSGTANFSSFSPILINDKNWTAPTLAANWANSGTPYANAGYYKDFSGMVKIRGMVTYTNASNASAPTIFTLPVGYRPSANIVFPVYFTFAAGGLSPVANADLWSVEITPAGVVYLVNFLSATAGGAVRIDLSTISFPTF